MANLKWRLAADPKRLARALRALYKRAGLTPGRNLVALLFLPILALAVGAAIHVAQTQPSGFLWVPDLAHYDPWQGLPALFAALNGIYLHIAFVTSRRHTAIVWLVAVPALFAAAAILPAAAGLYMSASAALLLAQRFLVSGVPGLQSLKMRIQHLHERIALWRLADPGIIALNNVPALANAGTRPSALRSSSHWDFPCRMAWC